ncbi:predicted protein [Histoplasma capsulatum G186AR]|uniref:Uncharacterized protein n=1 Tax=Ajellomyces capsulatus (strain G186AR / H82 / ATCC MYA-2454 / RMSCC 2432) TaxID=447093 RepID=C0P0Q2_AJECG|nr:uncharacterized protein HCBG_08982 [Histoplasma capsulatum G186AR]EEH02702.1 predicted protein [Histoplasma capsulatum G186AR]
MSTFEVSPAFPLVVPYSTPWDAGILTMNSHNLTFHDEQQSIQHTALHNQVSWKHKRPQICSAKGEQRKIEGAVKAHQAQCGFRLVQGHSGTEGVWPKSMFWIQYN